MVCIKQGTGIKYYCIRNDNFKFSVSLFQTQHAIPNLLNQICSFETKPNLPNQIYKIESTKQSVWNVKTKLHWTKKYQTKSFQSSLKYKVHPTNSTKSNIEEPNIYKIQSKSNHILFLFISPLFPHPQLKKWWGMLN